MSGDRRAREAQRAARRRRELAAPAREPRAAVRRDVDVGPVPPARRARSRDVPGGVDVADALLEDRREPHAAGRVGGERSGDASMSITRREPSGATRTTPAVVRDPHRPVGGALRCRAKIRSSRHGARERRWSRRRRRHGAIRRASFGVDPHRPVRARRERLGDLSGGRDWRETTPAASTRTSAPGPCRTSRPSGPSAAGAVSTPLDGRLRNAPAGFARPIASGGALWIADPRAAVGPATSSSID